MYNEGNGKSLETKKMLRNTNHCVVNPRYCSLERKKNMAIHLMTQSFKTLNDSAVCEILHKIASKSKFSKKRSNINYRQSGESQFIE